MRHLLRQSKARVVLLACPPLFGRLSGAQQLPWIILLPSLSRAPSSLSPEAIELQNLLQHAGQMQLQIPSESLSADSLKEGKTIPLIPLYLLGGAVIPQIPQVSLYYKDISEEGWNSSSKPRAGG